MISCTKILSMAVLFIVLCGGQVVFADDIHQKSWEKILADARGQEVYFNGWGGNDGMNDYVRWAAAECKKRYGFTVHHVKVTDISEVVGRIFAEKSVGKDRGGSVDLVWINGENFYAMKEHDLLLPSYVDLLPNKALIDWTKPSNSLDFTVPVEGLEVPWGIAQLVFMYDTDFVQSPPQSMAELLAFAHKNPGKFTYPAPPAFDGTTFLKQALLELVEDKELLQRPVDAAHFTAFTEPLWQFLDELHPLMWRKGEVFVNSSYKLHSLLDNSEIYISFNFNPNEPSRAVENGEIPESIRSYVHRNGMIGNSHFVAVPYNATAPEAALVFANFLLSPEAQAYKNDPQIWGDPTVLDLAKLSLADAQRFYEIDLGDASLKSDELGTLLPEPHASWVDFLEATWLARYYHR